MTGSRTIDSVPVAYTPAGGWIATYEEAVHVLRPDGLPIEVRRWRDGDYLMWDYASFVARMRRLADAEHDPTSALASMEGTEQ